MTEHPIPGATVARHETAMPWTPQAASRFMHTLRQELARHQVGHPDPWGYGRRGAWVLVLCTLAWFFLPQASGLKWGVLMLLGTYAVAQGAAIGHEVGHRAVTNSARGSLVLGHLFMTVVVGMPYSAWQARHRRHHLHPNSRHDPDIRPWIFSFHDADARAATGLRRWFTRRQSRLMPPLATLMGFSIKGSGWKAVLRSPGQHGLDIALLAVHLLLWVGLPAGVLGWAGAWLNYTVLTWLVGTYLALVFVPNHLGGSTSEACAHWPPALRQIVTARNLPDKPWLSHLWLGQNSHIEHHAFAHFPATQLARARAVTRTLCRAHGIPYRECTLREAMAEIQAHNRRMEALAQAKPQEPHP